MINKLKEKYVNFWKETRNENSCAYNKKLRTYNTFKGDYKLEDYLLLDIEKKEISTFVKLRISDSKLMIEQGRHRNMPLEKRICPICETDIEDEYHFITQCITPLIHTELNCIMTSQK